MKKVMLVFGTRPDQFDDFEESVYVGYTNCFYNSFGFISAAEHYDIDNEGLIKIYEIVKKKCLKDNDPV